MASRIIRSSYPQITVSTGRRFGGRCLNDGHILGSHQRKIKRSWNRRRRKRQDIDQLELFLELFFVAHPESLFLVDNDETKFLELNIAGDQSVGADDDINGSISAVPELLLAAPAATRNDSTWPRESGNQTSALETCCNVAGPGPLSAPA